MAFTFVQITRTLIDCHFYVFELIRNHHKAEIHYFIFIELSCFVYLVTSLELKYITTQGSLNIAFSLTVCIRHHCCKRQDHGVYRTTRYNSLETSVWAKIEYHWISDHEGIVFFQSIGVYRVAKFVEIKCVQYL